MNEQQVAKDFWNIADEVETVHIKFENIYNLIQLLDEGLERDVSCLVNDNGERAKWFIARYNMHQAQLTAIEILFKQASQELYELFEKCNTHK